LWIYGAKKKIEESASALRFRVGVPNGFLCAANSSTVKQSLQLYERKILFGNPDLHNFQVLVAGIKKGYTEMTVSLFGVTHWQ